MLQGLAASPGIALGRVYILEQSERKVELTHIASSEVGAETERFAAGLKRSLDQLSAIVRGLEERGAVDEAGIVEGQLLLLSDLQLKDDVTAAIEGRHIDACSAVHEVFGLYLQAFEAMDDAYLKERATDMKDARDRLVDALLGREQTGLEGLEEPVIVIASDLTPSVTAQMDKTKVLGFVTEVGSRTSHTSILARTLGIPAIVGCKQVTRSVKNGEFAVLDGQDGVLILSPDAAVIETFSRKRAEREQEQKLLELLKDVPAATKDGLHIELMANIGHPAEADSVGTYGGDGVGLFRSEFLFMDRETNPSEEEQLQAYRETAERLEGKPLTIRTLDVGGDKNISYLPIGHELNPFLGWRAIRYCLADTSLFKTQLRAILRASEYGNVRVMFPMISGLEELNAALNLLEACKAELRQEGHSFNPRLPVGIMIEVPSAAVISDRLAPLVDFFSIGTNDLIQYTLAADRMNEKVSYLYEPRHPAVLRLIELVCHNAKKHGKSVGMCGEMAGDPAMAELLIGLGVDEWSMSPTQIPEVKNRILQLSQQECVEAVQTYL